MLPRIHNKAWRGRSVQPCHAPVLRAGIVYWKQCPKLETNHVSSIPLDRKIHATEEGHAARHVRLNLLAQLLELLAEYRSQQQRPQDYLKESHRGWHVFGAERGNEPGYGLVPRSRPMP